MKCEFCEDKNVVFTCEKCGASFCINHVISTEKWYCKEHNLYYSRANAKVLRYRCSIIERSSCPECKSLVQLDKLSSGQFYLKCTDKKCGWNSYLKSPGIFYPYKERVLRDAKRLGIIRFDEICNKKLRKFEGKEVCPKCLLAVLKSTSITNFTTLSTMFNVSSDEIVGIIKNYINENKIYGIIDKVHNLFYYISSEIKQKVISKIEEEGIIENQNLSSMLDMSSDNTIKLILKLIKEYKIKGSFTTSKKKYYTKQHIFDILMEIIDSKGRISIKKLSEELDLHSENIKNFCVNLMKLEKLVAFFADKGNEVITQKQLNSEIKKYAKDKGIFKLNKISEDLKIAVELSRRTLFNLIQSGGLKGVFTQRREFMTQKHLEIKIKEITKVYRKISLTELARRLGITESNIEEKLAILISRGSIEGYIDSLHKIFILEKVTPIPSQYSIKLDEIPTDDSKLSEKVEVLREYDFQGGQLHFKVVVRNHSNVAIHSIKILLDAPSSYNLKQEIISIPVIEPGNSRGVDFYLEPRECGISSIGGTVIYKSPKGEKKTIHLKRKDVQIKCPLVITTLDNVEDCQLAIQDLPSDARAFMIADLDPRLAFRAAQRTLKSFETTIVTSHEEGQDDNYQAEAWYCAEAKVTGGRIITRIFINSKNQSLELRVWCGNPGQLTGWLAKIIEILFEQINIIRKIKSEEREKTLDIMVITQNLMEISDYCMLKWRANNIRIKLQDTFVRVRKILGETHPVLDRIEFWLTSLNKYSKNDNINDNDAEKLADDIENFKSVIGRAIKL